MIKWNAKILDNFKLREAACKCGCDLVILDKELLVALDSLRRQLGMPLIVSSWTRCKDHNERIGGAKNSYHINGRAVDLGSSDLATLEESARRYFLYVKGYDTHIHCDIRGERP